MADVSVFGRTNGLWKLGRLSPEASALTTLFTVEWWNSSEWLFLSETVWKLSWGKQRDSCNKESTAVEAVIRTPAGLPLISQGSRLKAADTMVSAKATMSSRLMNTEQKVINSLKTCIRSIGSNWILNSMLCGFHSMWLTTWTKAHTRLSQYCSRWKN